MINLIYEIIKSSQYRERTSKKINAGLDPRQLRCQERKDKFFKSLSDYESVKEAAEAMGVKYPTAKRWALEYKEVTA